MGVVHDQSRQGHRQRSSRRQLATAGTVLGILAGALLGTVFDSSIKGTQVLITAVCALIIASLLLISFALIRFIAESADRHEELTNQLDRLRQSMGQTVEYQLIDDLNASFKATGEDSVTRTVMSAKSEILVLDIVEPSGGRPSHSMDDDLLRQFLEGILNHVESTSTVTYHRICQVKNPRSKLPTASPTYHSHLLALLRNRSAGRYRFSLKVAKLRYPFKFVLVDRRVLVLQLNRYDAARDQEAWSELVFWEAESALVNAFYSMWCDVDSDALTRALTEADLVGPLTNNQPAPVPKLDGRQRRNTAAD
ncbi:hypothetical protein [Micromonospora arida]|uniref:hypothetical protein n=1 Tax=Micromonospora arida TaxID=2203715 RepID=UPI0033E00679